MQATGSLPLISLHAHVDERGMLVAIEGGQDIPFHIERVYYIIGVKGTVRGFHAHRKLNQLVVCVTGSCRLIVDDGSKRREVILDRADRGLHLGPMLWREMCDFSEDSVLMVLASAHHDEADYIYEYSTFLAEVRDRAGS